MIKVETHASEDKKTLSEFESATTVNDVKNFNSNESNMVNTAFFKEEELNKIVDTDDEDSLGNLVIDEDDELGNLVIDEDGELGNLVIDEDDELGNLVIDEEELGKRVRDDEENVSHYTEIENKNDEKKINSKHKKTTRKENCDKGVEEKALESKSPRKKPNRDLDPKYWLKLSLSEEEAVTEFKARSQDPKYLTAAYKCIDCISHFSKEDILNKHYLSNHSRTQGPIECQFCKSRFKSKGYLKRHMAQHYIRYKCLRCQQILPLKSISLIHNDYHIGAKRKCIHCDAEFRNPSSYYTHLRTHRSEHVCVLCGVSFVSKLGLKHHTRLKHVTIEISPNKEVDTYCARCDITFETRKAFEEHFLHSAMHSEDDESLTDEASSPSMAKQPRKTIYGKKSLPQNCAVTGSFAIHLNMHTREKVFTCETCSMQFNCRSSVTRHQLTHTGEKPFACSVCGKRFTQKGSMLLHHRKFHPKEANPKRIRTRPGYPANV